MTKRNLVRIAMICIFISAGLILLLLQGCALRPVVPYDLPEKALLAAAIGGQIFDYTSTKAALGRGCIEGNPLMSSDAVKVGGKIGVSAMAYFGANAITDHKLRKIYLGIIGAIGIGAGIHNEMIDCSPGD